MHLGLNCFTVCVRIMQSSHFVGDCMLSQKTSLGRTLATAFPYTIPVMAGYVFLGMSYGILMKTSGFPFWYPILTSVIIFAGSMEFLTVNLLLSAFNPILALSMALMINARHLFYGLSMLEKYKGTGIKKLYLIFGLTDETFSVNCAITPPADVDRSWFYFLITLLNHCYWVTGATLGGIFGSFIHFNTEGLDFVMTALFVVILLEHLLKNKDRRNAVLGMLISLASLVIFGADSFILPAMACILIVLLALSKKEVSA